MADLTTNWRGEFIRKEVPVLNAFPKDAGLIINWEVEEGVSAVRACSPTGLYPAPGDGASAENAPTSEQLKESIILWTILQGWVHDDRVHNLLGPASATQLKDAKALRRRQAHNFFSATGRNRMYKYAQAMVQQRDYLVNVEALGARHSLLGVAVPGESAAEQQGRLQKQAACQAAITDHQDRMLRRCDEEIQGLSRNAPSPTTSKAARYAIKDDSGRKFAIKVIKRIQQIRKSYEQPLLYDLATR